MQRFLILIIAIILAIAGCKKDGDSSNTNKLKRTLYYGATHITQTDYSYINGKLAKRIWKILNSSQNPGIHIYEYSNNLIIAKYYTGVNGDYFGYADTFYLNNKGFVDSSIEYSSPSRRSTTRNWYDNDGYCIKLIRQDWDFFSCGYVIENGNPAYTIRYDTANEIIGTSYYEYYPEHFNNLTPEVYGTPNFGRASVNPCKTTTRNSNTGDTAVTHCSYKYDSKSRIQSRVTYDANGVFVDSIEYSYY
jgi:hypothetical protein